MSLELEIALFCIYGLRLGYVIWRYSEPGRYFAPGTCILLAFGSMLWLMEADLGTMTYEQQISTAPIPTIYLLFIVLPMMFGVLGLIIAAYTDRWWYCPTLELRPFIWLRRATRKQHRRVALIMSALTFISWTFPGSTHRIGTVCLACTAVYMLIAYCSLLLQKVSSPEGQKGDAALTYN